MASAHVDRLASAILFLLPFVVLGRGLLPGKVLSPADHLLAFHPWRSLAPEMTPSNPLLLDVAYMFHPWLLYAASEIHQGRFPLWNPYVFAGAPFLGALQPALLFPLTALAYVLPGPMALSLITVLKFSIAGLTMYWFLRALAVSPIAAVTGGLAFMFNGALVVWAQWTYASTMMLLPALLGVTERLRQHGSAGRIAALALVVALDLFAGYPQGTLYGWLTAAVWALVLARTAPSGGLRFLARFVIGSGLGTLLAAVQIFPFLEYTRESSTFAYRRDWLPFLHLPLRAAITFLLPYYYGSPTGGDFWGDWNFNELSVSVGLVAWVVVPVAVGVLWHRTGTRFFVSLAAVAAAILYGVPWAGEALWSLPLVGWGISLRVAPLLALALSALTALGVDAIATAPPASRQRIAMLVRAGFLGTAAITLSFVVADFATVMSQRLKVPTAIQYLWFLLLLTFVAAFALRWLRDRGKAASGFVLALAQFLSVLPLTATYLPVIDVSQLYPETPAVRWLGDRIAQDRSRILMEPWNVTMLYGLSAPTGNDGLTPRRIEEIARPPGSSRGFPVVASEVLLNANTIFASPVRELLGIRYYVIPPGMRVLDPGLTLEYDGPDARVYRNERALPRAFVVPRARCVDDRNALRLIWARAVDFRREVLLADACHEAPPGSQNSGGGSANILEYLPERVVIEAVTSASAYLVVTDTWFPGWQASVDGVETTVWRANHAFRAVWLSPGRHRVEFLYRPASLRIGLIVSGSAALATTVLLLVGRGFSWRAWSQASD